MHIESTFTRACDFAPVILPATTPTLLAVNPQLGVKTTAALVALAATPAAVIAKLNEEINAALQLFDVRERLSVGGMDVVGGTPAALATEMREGYQRYGKVVRDFGIQAD